MTARLPLSTFAAASVLLALALGLASCGDTEEDTSQVATAAPTTSAQTPTPGTSQGSPTAQATPPTVTPTPSSSAIPDDWLPFKDPVLSLRYPPDLVVTDLTSGAAPDSQYVRVVDFRSHKEPSRGFSVEVSSNPAHVSLSDWALQYAACVPGSVAESTAVGRVAVTCTEEVTETPNALVIFEHEGLIYEIGSLLSPAELSLVMTSFKV